MKTDMNEPSNRPKERIEKLITDTAGNGKEFRVHDRLKVAPGTEVFFSLVCKGEVLDISENGISVRFKPTESISLEKDAAVEMAMDLDEHRFRLSANVRRVETRFGVVVIGMEFDAEEIAIE